MKSKHDAIRTLFFLRRTARAWIRSEEHVFALARSLDRDAKKLKMASRFYVRRAEEMHKKADDVRQQLYKARQESERGNLEGMGVLLRKISSILQGVTTLNERCDLLNVNIADRGDLTEDDSIFDIVFVHALEDSAFYRTDEDNFNKPLFRVSMAAMIAFVKTPRGTKASEEAFDEVFGGMFPLPGERPVNVAGQGSTQRKPTLH